MGVVDTIKGSIFSEINETGSVITGFKLLSRKIIFEDQSDKRHLWGHHDWGHS